MPPKTKTTKAVKTLQINIDTELAACFVSPYRNFRWVGKSEDRYLNKEDRYMQQPGIATQFEEGVAFVEDQEVIAMMIADKAFGVDYCIDPADRTGFWKLFRETYSDKDLAETFPMGIPAALNAEMAASVHSQMLAAVGSNRSQRGVIHTAKGRVPIMDGGRERLTEEQQEKIDKIRQGAEA